MPAARAVAAGTRHAAKASYALLGDTPADIADSEEIVLAAPPHFGIDLSVIEEIIKPTLK